MCTINIHNYKIKNVNDVGIACQKVCKQGIQGLWKVCKPHPCICFTLESNYSVKNVGVGLCISTYITTFVNPYLVCILFGIPSLHLFPLYFFISAFFVRPDIVRPEHETMLAERWSTDNSQVRMCTSLTPKPMAVIFVWEWHNVCSYVQS